MLATVLKSMWMRSTKAFNYALEKLGKSKFGFERTAVSNFKSKRHKGSGNEIVDYSRASYLSADQKTRGLLMGTRLARARLADTNENYFFR